MKRQSIVFVTLTFVAVVPLLFFFWRLYYYWDVACGNSLFEGLLGALLGVFVAAVVALIAYWQLSNIARTTSTDFIHKLKNDFFVEQTRILFDHIVENRLVYTEISGKRSENEGSVPSSDVEMAYFKVDQTRILSVFPDVLKDQLLMKNYYLEVEIDDFLLGHFEDIGLFEEKGLIDTEMAYEEFSYYVIETFENEEIKGYIGDPDFCEQEFGSKESAERLKTISQLCQTIAEDIFDRSRTTSPSLGSLNYLLKLPSLHKKITKKKRNIKFSERTESLLSQTWRQRNKEFSSLDGAAQRKRKALNRLLLEEAYPGQLPKNDYIRSDKFEADMWSKFTYLYYRLKDIEKNKNNCRDRRQT